MTPMAYAWTLFSGASIIKRQLTWTNDDPFAGSEVYGDVYQVVGVPLYTGDEWKARAEAAEKALREPDLETAARAICKGRGLDPDGCYFGAGSISTTGSTFECYQYNWQCYLGDARAALEAKP